jgi:histidine triad (HIT) family protein
MEDCIFCKIAKGEIPSSKVYEDEVVLAFEDINPVAPVHVVVIPKQHIPTFMDVTPENMDSMQAMVVAAQEVARLKGVDKKGFRIVLNCNKDGGQVVFHLHLHVLGGRKLPEGMA